MRLYFVRHGESEANRMQVFSNRGFKHPLTAQGIAQAHALAPQLAQQHIAHIISSPLERAVQTATILAHSCGGIVRITDALREWDVGILEGTTDERGWEMHRQIQEDWFVHQQYERRIPDGESFLDIRARFVPFIEQLVHTLPYQDAAVLVGHGGLYHAMLPVILHNIDHAFAMRNPLANTAYVLAETQADRLYCREWCGISIGGT